MNPWVSSSGGDSQLMQLYKIGQSGGRNPVQESQYQQLLRDAGLPSNATPSSGGGGATGNSSGDVVQTAQQIAQAMQQAQIQANQPAIATLQGQQTSLQDQYTSLLNDIKGQGSASVMQATTAENNLLGQRGITNDSPLFGQQMSQALIPVNQQYGGLEAQLGAGSASTLTDLANSIAQLQAGNLPQAENFAGNVASLAAQLQAQQIANQRPFAASGPVYNPSTGQWTMPPTPTIPGASASTTGNTIISSPSTTTPSVTNNQVAAKPAQTTTPAYYPNFSSNQPSSSASMSVSPLLPQKVYGNTNVSGSISPNSQGITPIFGLGLTL